MDGVTLNVIRCEVRGYLPLKVQKVQQLGKREIALSLWARGVRERLVLSLEGEDAFFGFSNEDRPSSLQPSGFCLALRKRLEGGSLLDVRQERLDRVLYLDFDGHDDLGGHARYVLVFDMAGQGQNMGLYRDGLLETALLPLRGSRFEGGEPYVPPVSTRIDVREFAGTPDAAGTIAELLSRGVPSMEALSSAVEGLGKELAKGILADAGQDPGQPFTWEGARAVAERLLEIASSLCPVEGLPTRRSLIQPKVYQGPKGFVFHAFPLPHLQAREEFATALDGARRYRALALEAREAASLRAVAESLHRKVSKKVRSKYEAQMEDLAACGDCDKYRLWAQLIDMSGKRNPPGASQMTVVDYYKDPPEEVVVPLDPRYSSRDNARAYYKTYSKLTRRQKALEASIKELETVLGSLARAKMVLDGACTADEFRDIIASLEPLARSQGVPVRDLPVIREAGKPGPGSSFARTQRVDVVKGPEGATFFIGRNARQNDYLVARVRRPGDLWLHVKGAKGAHVLVRPAPGQPVSERALLAAADIAAKESEAGSSRKVEVDYVDASRVVKPPGSAPGFVTYTGQKTVVVPLDESHV